MNDATKGVQVYVDQHPQKSKVYIDGKDVSHYVEHFELDVSASELPRVVLYCINTKIGLILGSPLEVEDVQG